MTTSSLNPKAIVCALAAVGVALVAYDRNKKNSRKYPYTQRQTKRDTYKRKNGDEVVVEDPYFWLEDPDSPETKSWVDAQNNMTFDHLAHCEPARSNYKAKMTEMLNYERDGAPFRRGDNYFFYRNDGLQNHFVLYKQTTLKSIPTVFIDPNKLSDDGSVSLSQTYFTKNGEWCAYTLSQSGSDWRKVYIKNVASGQDLPEILEWAKFTSISWTHDFKGFFYCRYPKPDDAAGSDFRTKTETHGSHSIYYHELDTAQSSDVLVYSAEMAGNPKWLIAVRITHDGQYLLTTLSETTDPVNRLYYANIKNYQKADDVEFVKLVDNFDAEYDYITNEENLFYFKTNLNAPRCRVICINTHQHFDSTEEKTFQEIIPQSDTNVLNGARVMNKNQIMTCWMKDVKEVLILYDYEGSVVKDDFVSGKIGSIYSLNTRKEDSEFFFTFSSFAIPSTVYRGDMTEHGGELAIYKQPNINGFDPDIFETKQVFYNSKDGERIPMFIVHKKGLELNGDNPVLLYGYGGFSISITPYFSVKRVIWMQHFNAVFAVANLRGGGEYGEIWHKAGCHHNKQNVFDDFHAAAEYLIHEKYTNPSKIVVEGGSNGGLLIGAVVNQRPELYGCALAHVGVMDMLKFQRYTIGYLWVSDFGSAEDSDHFDNLYGYSPLHNIKSGKQYPAFLSTTADHDDRVVPLHSYKHMAELQYQLGEEEYQKNPLLIRVDVKAGHGAGKSLEKMIDEDGDCYGFAASAVHAEWVE